VRVGRKLSLTLQGILVTAAALVVSLSPAWAVSDGIWSTLAPPGRSYHSLIYDPLRQRLVLFGGSFERFQGVAPESLEVYRLPFHRAAASFPSAEEATAFQ